MKKENTMENKHFDIDVFGSKEIDLLQVKTKKRRKVDDYDYNDPFFEPFEGEMDAVDIECKLENFYVYKGSLESDAKKTARKYNRILKRPVDKTDTENKPEGAQNFAFEMNTAVASRSTTYKKDEKFKDTIKMYLEGCMNDGRDAHLQNEILNESDEHKGKAVQNDLNAEEIPKYQEELKTKVNDAFELVSRDIADDKSYISEGNSCIFVLGNNKMFVDRVLEFIVSYMMYYRFTSGDSMTKRRNMAYDYVKGLFPEKCTNKLGLKRNIIGLYEKIKGDTEMGADENSAENAVTLETINTTELNETGASHETHRT